MAETTGIDLLCGLAEIADFLGVTPRKAKQWAADNIMPTFKLGKNICARPATLRAWLAEREAAAQPAAKP